ncbi:fungal-specific transcription factor domain-containing protein, partial [Fusarium solani]
MDGFIDKDCDRSNPIKHTRSRRRAARACMPCRARKVRCDVSEKWPCGNCTWDHRDCVVLGRRTRRFALPSLAARSQLTTSRTVKSEPKPVSEACEPLESPARTSVSTAHSSPQRELFDIEPRIQLQAFIKPLPTQIEPRDVAYLISMGALSLPGVESQNALLRAYFEFTYPYMPILDISDFLGALTGQNGSLGHVSLFLFQAILFSGAAHVQLDCLKAAGFATREQAREELFRRVRLLYDLNYESDPFVLVQGLLLMSLRYDDQDDHRKTWHWIDVAFSQAFMCQLHRDSEHRLFSVRARKLRRRVWWSCFIRDQLTSVEMKRLPRIRDGEYDVPTLDDDDFEFEDVHPEFATLWRATCPYIGDEPRQKDMATLFIAKASLCHILAEYSFICHSINSYATTGILSDQLIESHSSNNNSGNDRLSSLKHKLEAWNEALPDCCRYRLRKKINVPENTGIEWNAMVLQVMYRSLVLSIER